MFSQQSDKCTEALWTFVSHFECCLELFVCYIYWLPPIQGHEGLPEPIPAIFVSKGRGTTGTGYQSIAGSHMDEQMHISSGCEATDSLDSLASFTICFSFFFSSCFRGECAHTCKTFCTCHKHKNWSKLGHLATNILKYIPHKKNKIYWFIIAIGGAFYIYK